MDIFLGTEPLSNPCGVIIPVCSFHGNLCWTNANGSILCPKSLFLDYKLFLISLRNSLIMVILPRFARHCDTFLQLLWHYYWNIFWSVMVSVHKGCMIWVTKRSCFPFGDRLALMWYQNFLNPWYLLVILALLSAWLLRNRRKKYWKFETTLSFL